MLETSLGTHKSKKNVKDIDDEIKALTNMVTLMRNNKIPLKEGETFCDAFFGNIKTLLQNKQD